MQEIVMYSRTFGCPYVRVAKRVFDEHNLDFREVQIDRDPDARERVVQWTGFQSVPTIVLARPGEDLPFEDPAPLLAGQSPKGVDRGSMITEPSDKQLLDWLRRNGMIE